MDEIEHSQLQQILQSSSIVPRLKSRAGLVAGCQHAGEDYGLRLGVSLERHTPVEIASLTKGFTGILLGVLLQDGRITVDSRVDEMLFQERWPDGSITVEDLVTHTSGLPRLSISAWRGLFGNPYRNPYRNLDREHVLRFTDRFRPPHPAQHKVFYSNLGFAVLGLMLESACSATFGSLLDSLVLRPLGMAKTRLQLAGGERLVDGGIGCHLWRTRPWMHDAYTPAGGLVSTLVDLSTALTAFCSPEHPL